MIEIDGSHGEGGGQIVRSSLALSMVTGQAVSITNIRARRKNPGLARQHLTAVQAARRICRGGVEGAELRSQQLVFGPGAVQAGQYTFDVGTAGSTSLVLQTVLPPLMIADGPSQLRLQGGTHNTMAPPFDYLAEVYLPLVERIGPQFRCELVRHGFYPAGGGEAIVHVQPRSRLNSLTLLHRGRLLQQDARAIVSRLPLHVAEREIGALRARLRWKKKHFRAEEVDSPGPGNVILATLQFENVTEMFVGFGQRGVPAERVAGGVAREIQAYLAHDAPVGEHLADQLLLPLGIAAHQGQTGAFRTTRLSGHSRTHIEVLRQFLDVQIETAERDDGTLSVELRPRTAVVRDE